MTPEQIEFHRKRFEQIMRFNGFVNAHFEKNSFGGYIDTEVQHRFSGYLMAIDSIEVELPKDDGSISQNAYKIDCEAHLQSQGLMVKLC